MELCLFDGAQPACEVHRLPIRERDRPGVARLFARGALRPPLWLPARTALRAGGRAPFQPDQALARSLRAGHHRRRDLGRRALRLPDRRPRRGPLARRARQRPLRARSVVVDPAFSWGDDRLPRIPWNRTVIYESHVKGFTMRHPDVPGTCAGRTPGWPRPRSWTTSGGSG